MACPVILPDRDEDILIDIERSGKTLRKYVDNVVVAVGTVIEFDAKCVLPLLGLQNTVYVWRVKDEAFEVKFTHAAKLRPRLEVHLRVITDAVIAFQEANLRIEVGTNFTVLARDLQPAVLIVDSGPKIGLPSGKPRRPCLRSVASQNQGPVKHQSSVCTARLVEAVEGISGAFVDANHANVGAAPQRPFDAGNSIVRVGVWTGTPRFHIHRADLEPTQRAGNFTSPIDRHFLARNRIDTNLAAEEQQVSAIPAQREVEDSGVL